MTKDIVINNIYYEKKYFKYKKKYLNLKLNILKGGSPLVPIQHQDPKNKLSKLTATVKKGSTKALEKITQTGNTVINKVIEGADNAIKAITGTDDNNVDIPVSEVASQEENKSVVRTILNKTDNLIKNTTWNSNDIKDSPVSLVAL